MSKKKPTWVYIYGDEMLEIWEHFGFPFPNPDDRIKLKFVKYESKEMQDGYCLFKCRRIHRVYL